jgi:hypothetical protein
MANKIVVTLTNGEGQYIDVRMDGYASLDDAVYAAPNKLKVATIEIKEN